MGARLIVELKNFYTQLTSWKKEAFDRLVTELIRNGCEKNISSLTAERDSLKQIIEVQQAKRAYLSAMKKDVDLLIKELEQCPTPEVQLSLLLSTLRTKSITLQDEIGEVVPQEEMRKKSLITQKIDNLIASRDAALAILHYLEGK